MTRAGRSTYHHPDLRAALLEHGIALAREGGPEAVSLRDVQRRAGVSNSAAYRHYADRAALLDAIAERANADLSGRMQTALDAVPDDLAPVEAARARLRGLGRVYVGFALAEPGLFATAFGDRDKDLLVHQHAGDDPYVLLGRCLDDLVAAGGLEPGHRPWSEVAAWSAVHGLAVLLGVGPLRGMAPADRETVIERVLDVLIAGLT